MTKAEKKKTQELLIEFLQKTPIIQVACEKMEISRMTLYRWKKDEQKFSKAVDKAMQDGCLMVNDLAESQLISAIKEKNFQAIAYWLRFHHPLYKQSVFQSGFAVGQDDEHNLYYEFFGKLKPDNQKLVESNLEVLNKKSYEKPKDESKS